MAESKNYQRSSKVLVTQIQFWSERQFWVEFGWNGLLPTSAPTHSPPWRRLQNVVSNMSVSHPADLTEHINLMRCRVDGRGRIAYFGSCFVWIKSPLLDKCGAKKKSHFERALWHWSSLCQLTWLNLESTGPNGPGGCKVPIDLAKILVKEPVHMGLYYTKILEKVAKCRPSVFGYGDTFVNDCWRLHGAASPAWPPILLVFSVRYLVNLNQKSRDAMVLNGWHGH